MDSILDQLRSLAARVGTSGRVPAVAGAFLLGAVLVAAGVAAHAAAWPEAVEVLAGATGGMAWLLAGYLAVTLLAPAELAARLDLRSTWALARRRRAAGIGVAAWIAVLVVAGGVVLPGPLVGALNVVVAGLVAALVTATPLERAQAAAAWEAAREARELAALAQAEQQAGGPVAPVRRRGLLRRLAGR